MHWLIIIIGWLVRAYTHSESFGYYPIDGSLHLTIIRGVEGLSGDECKVGTTNHTTTITSYTTKNNTMGDAISSLLFQPPPPTRLKESKVIWLTNSYGKRIPAFFIECPKDNTGRGLRSPLPGEQRGGSHSDGYGQYHQQQQQAPATPQIRTPKELEAASSAHGRNALSRVPTILYSHANAEDLGNIYPWCKFLSKMLGVNIFAYDYTGYGLATDQGMFVRCWGCCCVGMNDGLRSLVIGFSIHSLAPPNPHFTRTNNVTGDPSEEYCFADISTAYTYLTQTLLIPPTSILLYGRSLGSGPSCFLASRTAEEGHAVGGLILHAPFMSVYRIVIESGCTLPGDRFPNVDFAPSIRSPVLLIHGTKDSIVPFNHSERLLETVIEPYRADPLFIKGMGHNNVHASVRPLFIEKLRKYLDRHILPQVEENARMMGVGGKSGVGNKGGTMHLESSTGNRNKLARLVR